MLMKDRFKLLFPESARIKRIAEDDENIYWELYNEAESLCGYGIYVVVPEGSASDTEEFDKYEVTGIVGLDYKISALDIAQHPDHVEPLWAAEIIEPAFGKQYLGLPAEKIKLSPEGAIDAITESTMSSKLITEALRKKVEYIMKNSV